MKTFYSVNYATWGANGTSTKYFDNLEEAREFAKRDYTDEVVVRNYKNAEKIAEIERIISYDKAEYGI